MIAPPASLIDQMYRPMEGRGILETPEMLSGLDGLGGQLASIPGGPGAEQFPQAILDQGIHKRTGIEAGIAGMIPAGFGPSIMDPGGSGTAELITEQIDPNIFASLNSGFEKPYSEDMSGGINAVADPITNNFMPLTPQQPTGGFDSKVFANELLTGIGDLFKQHFPDSAQMAFNNSNQPQSQIEQPIQDATTFDVQPQQNTAYNPFSVNTIGGAFGGGY
jgi:hypothetical protein